MARSPRRKPEALGKEIASLLRELAARHEITQRELGRRTDISSSQINVYLRGIRSPTLDEFASMCHELNARPEVILGLASYNVDWRERNDADDDALVPLPEKVEWNLRSVTHRIGLNDKMCVRIPRFVCVDQG